MARFFLRTGTVLLWVLVGLVALVASILHHLDSARGRETICAELTRVVDEAIVGSFSARCEHLGLDHVRLGDVRIGLDDTELIHVAHAEAEPALLALLRGDIRVASFRVEDVDVDLRDFERVAAAFESTSPSEDDTTSELPSVSVHEVALVDVRARFAESIDVDLDVDGTVELGPGLRVELGSLHVEAQRDGSPLADLRATGVVDTTDDSRLDVRIAAGHSSLRVDAHARWGEELGSGPTDLRIAELDAHIDPRTLRSPALEAWTGSVPLIVPVDLALRGRGWLDDAQARGTLRSSAGDAEIGASWESSTATLRLETEELRLAELLEDAPEASVGGRLRASLDPDMHIELFGEGLHYDEWVLPEVRAEASLLPDAIQLASVSLPHLDHDGHLDVHGRIGFEGDVDLQVDANLPQVARDANVARLVPGLRSRVRASARVHVDEQLDIRGRVGLHEVSYSGVRAASLTASGRVDGAPAAPRVRADVRATDLRQGSGTTAIVLQTLAVSVQGRGSTYSIRGTGSDARARPIELDVHAVLADQIRLRGMVRAAIVLDEPYRLDVRELVVVGSQLDVDATLQASSGLHVDVRGRLGRRSDLNATLRELRLPWLDERFALGLDLAGVVSGRVQLRGSLDAPQGVAHLAVRGLRAKGAPSSDVQLDLTMEQRDGRARARTTVRLEGEHGGARVSGDIAFAGSDPTERVEDAELALTVNADEIQVATWAAPFTETSLAGVLRAEIRLGGTPSAPIVNGTASVDRLRVEEGDPIDVGLTSEMRAGVGEIDVSMRDARGSLARLHARTDALADARTIEALLDAPFEVSVRMPERRLDELPRPLRVDQPFLVSGRVTLTTGFRGDVLVIASHPSSEACTEGLPGVIRVEGQLRNEVLEVALRGTLDESQPLEASTRIQAPLRRWLTDGFPEAPPPIDLRAHAEGLDLGTAPIVCEQVSGQLDLEATVSDLFGEHPHVRAAGRVEDFSIGGTQAMQLVLDADANLERARANVIAHVEGRRAMRAHANVPLVWDEGIPALADEEWRGRVKLRIMPITPLLALVPNIRQPRGATTGDVRIHGRGDEIGLDGALELIDVSAILERPLIRFDALNGTIRISEEALELDGVRYRDREGSVRVDGRIGMEGLTPRSADVRARFDEMPFRVEGVVFATVDADAHVEARLSDTANEVELSLTDVDVKLPEDAGRVVQTLDQHGEVVFVDDVGFEEAMQREAIPEREVSRTSDRRVEVPTRIRVTTTPFWVRREDFSIQLDARLRVMLDPHLRMMGRVQVRRGFIELLGKNFVFQRGEIRFAGGRDIDPVLDLQADHELKTGETVTVKITGNLSRPELTFSTTVPGVQSEREVIQLLVSGRSTPGEVQTAQAQASSALAGLMAGFLSTLTRRELGAYVPVFRLEAEGTNTARVRAGFSADDIIPEFMRGVVVGAYVEGYVGTDQDDGGAQRTTGGVLIELLHPRNIVTRSTWEEPNNWSLDFIWEPL